MSSKIDMIMALTVLTEDELEGMLKGFEQQADMMRQALILKRQNNK